MYLQNSDIRQKEDTLFGFGSLPKIMIFGIPSVYFYFFQKTLGSYAKYNQHVKSFHFIILKFV